MNIGGFLGDIIFWVQVFWWLWLILLAFFFYQWAQNHVGFSPMLTIVLAVVLIYYLVIKHPFLGSSTLIFWTLLSSGVLYLLPIVLPWFGLLFRRR